MIIFNAYKTQHDRRPVRQYLTPQRQNRIYRVRLRFIFSLTHYCYIKNIATAKDNAEAIAD